MTGKMYSSKQLLNENAAEVEIEVISTEPDFDECVDLVSSNSTLRTVSR